MKLKYFAVAAAFVSCVFTANAQQEEKLGNDVWIGVNGGVLSMTTPSQMNKPQPYISIEVGKWFTPVWGGRVSIAGLSQYYGYEDNTWYIQDVDKWSNKQYFGELNVDGILNLTQAISKKSLPLVDFYLFLGPTMNLASRCTEFTGEKAVDKDGNPYLVVADVSGLKARFGATAGLGLSFNISKSCALGLEYRTGVTPSIFGDASVCRTAENTNRFSIRFAYTFGGRLGKDGYAKKHGRVEVETVTNTVEVPVEKIVTKEVVKEVEKVVTKTSVSGYVFFALGKYNITDQDKIRLSEVAKAIKEGAKDVVYTISGNADKSTGSAKFNQKLSENRAKSVYDFLVKEGVNADQLKIVANGGVDNMFFDQAALSRVAIIAE